MKQSILVLIAVFSISILNAQRYINIGSSKSDVKKVMGEPTSIRNYESLKKEVWGYGEYGLATVTFKNGKLFEYSNMDSIPKIGERSTINSDNPITPFQYEKGMTFKEYQKKHIEQHKKEMALKSDVDYSAKLSSLKSSRKQPNNSLRDLLGRLLPRIFFWVILFTLIGKKIT